jgi:2-polyprenyl-3-methyl-5-hydroxy-6-metoxy-1,4-benzoquinol methylase
LYFEDPASSACAWPFFSSSATKRTGLGSCILVTQNLRIEQERFEVGKFMPPWVRHQHTTRYEWVTQFVGGKKVLDVACGTGYGAVLLAKAGAEKVDGFDCSKEAVDHASSRYSHPVLSFSVADAEHLPVSDA